MTQAALRATSSQEPDIPIPACFSDLAKGWLPIAGSTDSARVEPACSSSINHANGRTDRTTTQGPRRLYSTRLLALSQLRYEAEQSAAHRLRRIDRMIEQEMANPSQLP